MLITHCYDINSSKEQLKYKGNVFITHINFFIIIARADMSGHSSFLGKYKWQRWGLPPTLSFQPGKEDESNAEKETSCWNRGF